MRSRLLTLAAALVLSVGGMLAVSASPALASQPAHCTQAIWNTHPDLYNRGGIQFAAVTLLMHGPFEDCTIDYRAISGDGINVHCKVTTNGVRWYYVEDTTFGGHGWASHDNLVFNTNNLVNDC